jgi:replicative DNA helicase
MPKLPPQNLEAEEALISAVLIDNQALTDIADVLAPDDFYKPAHRKIFAAMLALYKTDSPVDLVTLSNRLRQSGELENIGGAAYLARILDSAPMALNARHYAEIVHNKATLRTLLVHGNAIVNRCLDDTCDTEELLDWAESGIFKVSERKIVPTVHAVEDLLEGRFKVIAERQKYKTLYTGVPSGFGELDDLTSGFQNSDLIIIAARPSMGKTAFALNLATHAAVQNGVPTIVFSLEMSKEQLAMRLLTAESRVDPYRLKHGFTTPEDWKNLKKARKRLCGAPIYIDDASDITALKLRTKARRLKAEKKVGLVIIDYLQLMKVQQRAERRDLDISEISRSLKGLAKDLDIPVIALSQLNRQLENREDKRPRLSDLRESGALEQDADVVIFIHREAAFRRKEDAAVEDDGVADIIVAKQRNGPTDRVKLAYLREYTRFENPAVR